MIQTKFEEQLQQFFPDIYKIHQAGKFDKYIWDVFGAMMSMVDNNNYGIITISYQKGRINKIDKTVRVVANSTASAIKTFPGVIDE